MTGRIDVHSHLLPGIDDGCDTLDESLACAAKLVEHGYTHSFCTPHFWPSFPHTSVGSVAEQVASLQRELDAAGIALKLLPGGELGMRAGLIDTLPRDLPTYGMEQRYLLFDFWENAVPSYLIPTAQWIRSLGIQVVLAHPERIGCFQSNPQLVPELIEAGFLFQGNLECQADPAGMRRGELARHFLESGYYFMLGSDMHHLHSLDVRMEGLQRAIERVGQAEVDRLTRLNPLKLVRSGLVTDAVDDTIDSTAPSPRS